MLRKGRGTGFVYDPTADSDWKPIDPKGFVVVYALVFIMLLSRLQYELSDQTKGFDRQWLVVWAFTEVLSEFQGRS